MPPAPPAPSRTTWRKPALLLVIIAALGWLSLTHGPALITTTRTWIAGQGPLAPLTFLLLGALATMAFFPVALLAASAGLLFGPTLGIPLIWATAMLGAAGAFHLGRALSRDALHRLAGHRADTVNTTLTRHGTLAVFLLRLLPAGPYALINYLAATTSLTTRQLLLGTAAGILPGCVLYTTLGGTAVDPGSPPFLLAAAGLAALTLTGAILARRLRHRL